MIASEIANVVIAKTAAIGNGEGRKMTNLEYIAANLSDEDVLCQIAEEASELAKAALKLRRAITQTNPAPVTVDEAIENLLEEYGDTVGSFLVWAMKNGLYGEDVYEMSNENIESKYDRWADRIKEGKKHGN